MDWKRHRRNIYAVAAVFCATERIAGLAGIPDDLRAWGKILGMVPDPIGWAALGASVALLVNHIIQGIWAKHRHRKAGALAAGVANPRETESRRRAEAAASDRRTYWNDVRAAFHMAVTPEPYRRLNKTPKPLPDKKDDD